MQLQDDRQTFLLPRPVWVNDADVTHCASCNASFNAIRRRHHCRHCGNIFCHECSSRNVPLPQLGYGSKPSRVCNGCFEVAYLVTYAIDDDHGISTQIHGTRGLLELVEKDHEKDLHNVVAYGGIDALIWLCRTSSSVHIHHLTTTILALLAEKESVRPVIITKWALPPLLHLVEHYIFYDSKGNKTRTGSVYSAPTSPPPQQQQQQQMQQQQNDNSNSGGSDDMQHEVVLEILINCTHVFYQLGRAGILSQTNIIDDGVFSTLLTLAAFEPTIRTVLDNDGMAADGDEGNVEEAQLRQRVSIIQSLAAKTLSTISGQVSHQPAIIEHVRATDKFASLLRSTNEEVRKYIAKSIAYLSLRNDRYKPALLGGDVARALVSIIVLLPQEDDGSIDRKQDLTHYLSRSIVDESVLEEYPSQSPSAVSHACCALANFATNHESQMNLIAQPHLLKYICNVPAVFPNHTEVHRHVARCLANLALYEESNALMLAYGKRQENAYNVLPTLLALSQSANVTSDIQRHIVRAIDNLSAYVKTRTQLSVPSVFVIKRKKRDSMNSSRLFLSSSCSLLFLDHASIERRHIRGLVNNNSNLHSYTEGLWNR
ncbi:armadillo-type protein [Dichotomocladium elegans]|nr:armadillo-type protein [Dichotomocladium elegans]